MAEHCRLIAILTVASLRLAEAQLGKSWFDAMAKAGKNEVLSKPYLENAQSSVPEILQLQCQQLDEARAIGQQAWMEQQDFYAQLKKACEVLKSKDRENAKPTIEVHMTPAMEKMVHDPLAFKEDLNLGKSTDKLDALFDNLVGSELLKSDVDKAFSSIFV
mmetsp:Transcript_414/g.634  ORF Transcript_414/g.634 Transcript_414/m.634 type:complete len:161 (+) Transcript_414:48-530(+)